MKNMNIITIIGLILIFLGGLGGILLAVGQSISSSSDKSEIIGTTKSENKLLKERILKLSEEREELNKILKIRDERIQEKNEKIEALNNKLMDMTLYIEEFISGRGRFPYIELKRMLAPLGNEEAFVFSIENSFKYPLYNIEIQVFDYEKILAATFPIDNGKKKGIKMSDFLKAKIFEDKTDEMPGREFRIAPQEFFIKSGLLYITIRSRGMSVFQKVVLIQEESRIYAGYCIVSANDEILKEVIYDNQSEEMRNKIKAKLHSIPNDMDLVFMR